MIRRQRQQFKVGERQVGIIKENTARYNYYFALIIYVLGMSLVALGFLGLWISLVQKPQFLSAPRDYLSPEAPVPTAMAFVSLFYIAT